MNHLHGTVINEFNFNNIVMDAIYNTIAICLTRQLQFILQIIATQY